MKQKNKAGGLGPPGYRTDYKTEIIKTYYWFKDMQINRLSRNLPTLYVKFIFDKGTQTQM